MWKKLKKWSAMLLAAFLVIGSVNYTGLVAEADTNSNSTTYTFAELTKVGGWSNEATVDADGKISISFTGQYAQIFWAVPADVDATKLEKVTFDGLSGSDYGLKLLTQAGYDTDNKDAAALSYSGNELATEGATDIKYIGIMSTAAASAEEPNVITLDSLTFTVTAGSGDEGGDDSGVVTDRDITTNILANYNPNFENTYWWGDSGWKNIDVEGSTLTSGTYAEDAPYADCATKYVKVSGNMLRILSADLVPLFVEGNEYEYSYWIKLDTGSTGNAGLSIYSQTTSYSNDTSATLQNDKEITLSEEWTKVTGKFTMVDPQGQVAVKFSGDEGTIFCVDDFRIGLLKDNSQGGDEGDGDDSGDTPAGESVTYTFAQLTGADSWSNTNSVDADGKLTVSFTGHYAQHYYRIPADIDMTKIQKITVDNFSGETYELRLIDDTFSDSYSPIASANTGNTITVGTATSGNRVGFACTDANASAEAPVVMTADSITFWYYPDGEVAPTTSVLSYHFADIPVTNTWDGTCTVDELNRATVNLGSGYRHVTFGVPDEIRGMVITKVKVFFESGDSSVIATSLYDDYTADPNKGNGFENAWNGGIADHTLQKPENILQKFALKNGGSENVSLLIRKIEFTVQGTVEGGSEFISEVNYHFADVAHSSSNENATASTIPGGRLTLNFTAKDGESIFDIPAALAEAKLQNISIVTSVGDVNGLVMKLYDAEGNVLQTVEDVADFAVDEAANKAVKIGFASKADGAKDVTIDKISLVVDGDVTGGSTFVKEENFTMPVAAMDSTATANVTVQEAEADGNVKINFAAEKESIIFPIPADVDMSVIKYIDLGTVVSQLDLLAGGLGTPLNGVELQGYTAAGFASKTPAVTSTTSVLMTEGQKLTHFGLVSTAPTAGVQFSTATFVQKNLNKTGTMATYNGDQFTVDATSTAATTVVDDKLSITFNNEADEAVLQLPEAWDLWTTSTFAFTVSNQETPLNFVVYDEDMTAVWQTDKPVNGKIYYTYDREVFKNGTGNKKIAYIGILSGESEPNGASCTFDGMYINKREVPTPSANHVNPTYVKIDFTAADLKLDSSYGVTTTKTETGIKGVYGPNYSEIKIKFPYAVDMSQCETITVHMNGQNVPLGIKLYKGSDMKLVNYYNKYETSYTFKPYMEDKINKIGFMSLAVPNAADAYADIAGVTLIMKEGYEPPSLMADGIVFDPAFQDEELGNWKEAVWGSGVTLTQVVSPTPIYDNVNTYGQISKRTSPYECFSQDITGRVEQNKTYTFSFWAKLSEDYVGAPDEQRVVQFSPYTVDDAGVANYNPQLDGTYLQVLTPGVWTYYEGTWKVTHDNPVSSAFIRIIEQGTNYGQGECVKGSFAVTGVTMAEYIPDPPSIDEDVPDLKDALTEAFGDDFIAGTAIAGNEFDDLGVQLLANKHFNAITIGNELKPDYMFGYSNSQHTALQNATINGQTIQVPTIRFAATDAKLRQIQEWNASHPDEQIKVRGHVLVWHSQTPEWFFRENYVVGKNADGTENYVTPEVMNLRLEWYIKSILEHYVGENSEFKDMFYGWDVVNEAVGDGTGTYRTNNVTTKELPDADTHGSNSSWWAVYQSNEFIIKAFQFANKYAPAELELYYNDYNECDTKKVQGIVQLLNDVLAAEGTRIDAMGMQAHYNLNNPGMGAFERAIRAYAAVVGKVQLTEFDLKASDYIGSDDNLQREYKKQGEYHKKMFELLKKLDAEEGIEIGGVTFWGTTDKYSWLQSSSNVGGGADGTMSHCPLLFDGDYKVKPAFWAWVDYDQVDPDFVVIDAVTGKPLNPSDDDKADSSASEEVSENSGSDSEASEDTEATETLTVTTPGDEGGFNVVPIIVVIAAVVVAGGAAAAVLLKKKKLPKK